MGVNYEMIVFIYWAQIFFENSTRNVSLHNLCILGYLSIKNDGGNCRKDGECCGGTSPYYGPIKCCKSLQCVGFHYDQGFVREGVCVKQGKK